MTTDTDKLNLSKIGQIAVSVSDIDRATEFYRDTLGMRFLFSAPPSMSFFDCDGGVRLMLAVPERGSRVTRRATASSTSPSRTFGMRPTRSSRAASVSSASRTSFTARMPTTSGCRSSPTPTATRSPSWRKSQDSGHATISSMSTQEKHIIDLLQAKRRKDPDGFRKYLPDVARLLPDPPPMRANPKNPRIRAH